MTLSSNRYSFFASSLCGFLVWYFSEELTGRREPWDGNIIAYSIALVAIGFVSTYVFRSDKNFAYWGGYFGQALFGAIPFFGCGVSAHFCEDPANLFPLGLIFLLVYSLPLFIGAWLASKIRRPAAT
jgi:hypothetical protein